MPLEIICILEFSAFKDYKFHSRIFLSSFQFVYFLHLILQIYRERVYFKIFATPPFPKFAHDFNEIKLYLHPTFIILFAAYFVINNTILFATHQTDLNI